MVTIVRRSKPITVIRRSRPAPEVDRYGKGWPLRPGHPYNGHKPGYHVITIRGEPHVFLWVPNAPLGAGWTCGAWACSADVMGKNDYVGECTIVYRQPPSAEPPKFLRRRTMK
jgi:hypothetical protein